MGKTSTTQERDARSTVTLYSDFSTVDAPSATTGDGTPPASLSAPHGAPGERPWGAPHAALHEKAAARREELLKVLLDGAGKLLEPLQAALRVGDLTPDDVEQLNRLQLWYGRLLAEIERLRIAKCE